MSRAKLNDVVLETMVKAGAEGGVKVRFWPVWNALDQDKFIDTETTSLPWVLGHGEWVVSLKGKSGGQAVRHCVLLPLDGNLGSQGPAFGRPG